MTDALTSRIKKAAIDCGFEAVGVCNAEPLDEAGGFLSQWLDMHYHGSMDWMVRRREQRSDPKSFFPGAKSVLVVALNYYRENPSTAPGSGQISIYARGRDYHKVLRAKLKALLETIQILLPEVKGRICVDSFPIMEKPLAVKAGLGWIGKHTNLIIPKKGSFLFLGELLLDAELSPDPPFGSDHCGTCNRCQVACPTDALETAYVLEAQKCISYLTIEHDGPIEPQLENRMENWIFGCDICQDVCPWNRFSSVTKIADFSDRFTRNQLTLQKLADLTEDAFERTFEGTPVRRSGYVNFKRNVRIASSNYLQANS